MKALVKKILRNVGLEVHRVPKRGYQLARHDMEGHLRHVAARGFRPATVIDVGAADGTPPLLQVFPGAFHVLLEPLREFESDLRAIASRLRGTYRIAAANDTGNPVTLNVHVEDLHGSSLLNEEMGASADGRPRVVPGVRLDDLHRELNLKGPVLLKVDVQGAELVVLRGATDVLKSAELVILEVSFFNLMKDSPDVAEVVRFMADAGFVAYDIFGLANRPLDGALGQADFAFVRRDSFLRRDHRWASKTR